MKQNEETKPNLTISNSLFQMHFGITQNADENGNAHTNLTITLYILTLEIWLP
jgi:hypothetical protein